MKKGFVKLTGIVHQQYSHRDDIFPLYVNVESICSVFRQNDKYKETVVSTADGKCHLVKETAEEIMEMIGGGK